MSQRNANRISATPPRRPVLPSLCTSPETVSGQPVWTMRSSFPRSMPSSSVTVAPVHTGCSAVGRGDVRVVDQVICGQALFGCDFFQVRDVFFHLALGVGKEYAMLVPGAFKEVVVVILQQYFAVGIRYLLLYREKPYRKPQSAPLFMSFGSYAAPAAVGVQPFFSVGGVA